MERRWIEEVPGIRQDRVYSSVYSGERRPCLNDNQRLEGIDVRRVVCPRSWDRVGLDPRC